MVYSKQPPDAAPLPAWAQIHEDEGSQRERTIAQAVSQIEHAARRGHQVLAGLQKHGRRAQTPAVDSGLGRVGGNFTLLPASLSEPVPGQRQSAAATAPSASQSLTAAVSAVATAAGALAGARVPTAPGRAADAFLQPAALAASAAKAVAATPAAQHSTQAATKAPSPSADHTVGGVGATLRPSRYEHTEVVRRRR